MTAALVEDMSEAASFSVQGSSPAAPVPAKVKTCQDLADLASCRFAAGIWQSKNFVQLAPLPAVVGVDCQHSESLNHFNSAKNSCSVKDSQAGEANLDAATPIRPGANRSHG